MAKQAYKVLSPVVHNDKRYEVDAPITLDDDAAKPLLEVGAIEAASADDGKK
jgi:hypothetical protein